MEYLEQVPDPSQLWTEFSTPGLDARALLHELISERLADLGEDGEATKTLLHHAAVIGSSFSRLEIECILKWESRLLRKALESAERLNLIQNGPENVHFVHEALRDCLLCSLGADASDVHAALFKCLSFLRPSDYFTRAEHAMLSGDSGKAGELYFAGLLQRKREHQHVPDELSQNVFAMLDGRNYRAIATAIFEAHNFYLAQEYHHAVSVLEKTEHVFPAVFCAERDYLLSLCLLKSFNSTASRAAKERLFDWEELKESEKDLWCRIQLTLLVAHAHLGEWEAALRIERRVARHLETIRASDPGAETILNILRRKSSALYGAEISKERCRKAASYFGPFPDTAIPRNPAQYYMALCNLAGNLIVAGEFLEGLECAKTAAALEAEEFCDGLPRIEVSINNSVVAGFLADLLEPEAGIEVYQRLMSTKPALADRELLLNNLVVLTAMTGAIDQALLLCNQVESAIEVGEKDDSYYQYFIRTNHAGLLHLSGQTEEAIRLWDCLSSEIPDIPKEDLPYLLERQRLQRKAFSEVLIGDALGWQNYLQRNHPVTLGNGWRFFGRGFLLSDIQFWSET